MGKDVLGAVRSHNSLYRVEWENSPSNNHSQAPTTCQALFQHWEVSRSRSLIPVLSSSSSRKPS